MAEILKVYTAEQLYTMYEKKILADDVGLTDFNEGSPNRALIESNSEIVASIGSDFKEALYKSIPTALYEGFGFGRTSALKSSGYLRLYRKPAFTINYTGSGTSALITTDATNFAATVTGAPGDAFDFDYASYPTLTDLVSAIDALTNWEATLVKDGSIATDTIYQYTAVEVIGEVNYLNADGFDILFATDAEISIPEGYSVTINQLSIITTAEGTLEAGHASVTIAAEPTSTGIIGNIAAGAIDTLNGKGYINSSGFDAVEYVINDSAFSGGAAEETNTARKTRFADTVNSLNAGTKEGILNALRAISGVRSAGMRTSYPFKGTNTILIDNGSGTLSAALLAEIEKVLYGDPNDFYNYPGKNAEGIGYIIDTPTIVPVDISVSVYRLSNVEVDLTEIQMAVQTAIEQYINTRILGENVLLAEIIRTAMNSNAAVYNIVINSPSIDVVISDNEFAKTGAGTGGTVTVAISITTTF